MKVPNHTFSLVISHTKENTIDIIPPQPLPQDQDNNTTSTELKSTLGGSKDNLRSHRHLQQAQIQVHDRQRQHQHMMRSRAKDLRLQQGSNIWLQLLVVHEQFPKGCGLVN